MKKMQKSLMLVAAAAMAFVGCSKEDISDNAQPESGIKVTRSFTAEIAASRTTLNDAATRLKWTEGDQLGIFTDVTTDRNIESSVYAEGDTNFTAKIDAAATKVYAYYPYYNGQNTDKYDYTSVSLWINPSQTQSEAGTLVGEYVPMYAEAALVDGVQTVLSFQPVASLIAFNIYDTDNNGDEVQEITFTPAGDVKINGSRYMDLTTGKPTESSPEGQNTSATVKLKTHYPVPGAKPADKSGYIYLAVTPKEYSAGGTFLVTTNNGTYAFTTTNSINATNVYAPVVIPMNLAKGEFTPAKDYSGEYLIVGKKGSDYYACKKYVEGNNCKAVKITMLADGRFEGEGIEDCKMIVTGGMSGDKNLYSIQDADGNYLYVAGTSTTTGNNMKGTAKPAELNPESRAWWKISLAGDIWSIVGAYTEARNIMRFNDSSTLFSCYGSGQTAVSLIPWSQVKLDLTTSIVADNITDVPAAGVANQTFTFDIRNDAGYAAAVACDGTVVTDATVDNATKTVTYTVSENTDTAAGREGWIEIKLNDAAETMLRIIVSQFKKASASTLVVTQSFQTKPSTDFPQGASISSTTSGPDPAASYKLGEYSWDLYKTFWHATGGYLAFPKSCTCYIGLPVITGKQVTKIIVAPGGAGSKGYSLTVLDSSNTEIGTIEIKEIAVSNKYNLTIQAPKVGESYRLCNKTSKNLSLSSIEVVYE